MPHTSGVPNATLSFEILNAGEDDVSQIVVEVEVTEKTISSSYSVRPKVIAGPYTLIGRNKLMATHTWHVTDVLRNLTSDCACTANVTVVSFGEDRDRGGRPGPAENVSKILDK